MIISRGNVWVLILGNAHAGLHHRVDGYPQYTDKIVLPKVDSSPFWLLLDWAMQPAYPWLSLSTKYKASSLLSKIATYFKSSVQARA